MVITEPMLLLLVGAFAGMVVLVAAVGAIYAEDRRDAFATLAARKNWTYAARDDSWTTLFSGSPFGEGFDRKATNLLTGMYNGRPFVAFDYSYSTDSSLSDSARHTSSLSLDHPFSVVAVDTGAAFPHLQVIPEGLVGRISRRLGDQDIELESEDFNRAFTVTCPDRKLASDVLHPRMMQLLLTTPDLAWQLQGRYLLAVRAGSHTEAQVEATLACVSAIVDAVPHFVITDHRVPRGESSAA
jgi:hypothetical protein